MDGQRTLGVLAPGGKKELLDLFDLLGLQMDMRSASTHQAPD